MLKSLKKNVAVASTGVVAFGMAGLASAAVDTTAVQTALTTAETDAHAIAGTVIAIVAGLVVVGVIINLVRKV